jgi:hypothetical protein
MAMETCSEAETEGVRLRRWRACVIGEAKARRMHRGCGDCDGEVLMRGGGEGRDGGFGDSGSQALVNRRRWSLLRCVRGLQREEAS